MTNPRFEVGDRIRADLPDETDHDHERYHGRVAEVTKILEDAAGSATGDERDNILYRVKFENGDVADLRWRDLRPL